MFPWFRLGSTWFPGAGCSKAYHACLVLAWFQLGSAWFLNASVTKLNMFAWFRLGSILPPRGGVSPNTLGSLASTANRLRPSLVPAGFNSPAWFQLASSLRGLVSASGLGLGVIPSRPATAAVEALYKILCERVAPADIETLRSARAAWCDNGGGGDLPLNNLPEGAATIEEDLFVEGRDLHCHGPPKRWGFRLGARAFMLTFNPANGALSPIVTTEVAPRLLPNQRTTTTWVVVMTVRAELGVVLALRCAGRPIVSPPLKF